MDSNIKSQKDINPRENASLFSKITFIYAFQTLRKGFKKDLEEKDIYQITKNCKANTLTNNLEKLWKTNNKKQGKGILFSLFKIFGREFVWLGIVYLIISTIFLMSKPLLKGKIVSYFSPNQTSLTQEMAFYYCGALLACVFADTVFFHFYFFVIEQLAIKMKIAITGLIYRKSLKVNSSLMTENITGQAITLITKDINTFDYVVFFIHRVWVGVIQIIIMTYIMYRQIGVSAIIGVSVLFFFVPLQAYLGKKTSSFRIKSADSTDQRVKTTQEALSAIKIIKIYTWELFFVKIIQILRLKEIRYLRIIYYLRAIGLSIGLFNSKVALYICVMSYIALGNHITAEKAFVVTGCFASLSVVLTIFIPLAIGHIANLRASLQRLNKFLHLEEVAGPSCTISSNEKLRIFVKDASLVTVKDHVILKDINIDINKGLTIIAGPVGSGKSMLLKLILADVKQTEGSVTVSGNISYSSQEPWLFPGTIKQNITFTEWFDEKRYQDVIKSCALEVDFAVLPDGDKTRVIDKGLNLSRGQKTRINLARAIYKNADIYLLDDCLSAVDSEVSKHIFHESIKGLLKDKICLFVTHQEKLLKEADNVILLNNNCIIFQGSYDDFKKDDNALKEFLINDVPVKKDNLFISPNENEKEKDLSDMEADETTELIPDIIKNVYEETMNQGAIDKKVYLSYFKSGGIITFVIVIIMAIIAQGVSSWSDYFVSYWVDMEESLSSFRVNQTTNSSDYKNLESSHSTIMKQYSFVILGTAVLSLLRSVVFFMFTYKASNNIHNSMINSVLKAGMTFFDMNLSGNILNRFSRDLGIIDEYIPYILFECVRIILMLISILYVITTVNTIFLIPSIFFLGVLFFGRYFYIPTGRSIRRLEGSTRSPLVGHLTSTIEGLTTIRASEAQTILKKEFDVHQDLYNSVMYMHLTTARAFGFYLDSLSNIYVAVIMLTFLLFKTDTLAGKVGLAITQAFYLTGLLQWGIRQWAELENQMTSVERVVEYTEILSEDYSGSKPINWPNGGKIVFENINMSYSNTDDKVLKDVNFVIESKQKIGIVGRTGAGKSSIISALFRLYTFEGTITIDNIDSNSVCLEELRSKISIIPQDPVLFSGTIRRNLDPRDEYSDEELWDALTEVEMKQTIKTLDFPISDDGSNFSVGQRQLICLARAIVRKNNVLILDEATANIDPQTDVLIQKTVNKKFADSTVITIAHRLHTIMNSDKILVMKLGEVVEYDSPLVLLQNKYSTFYKMARDVGLV